MFVYPREDLNRDENKFVPIKLNEIGIENGFRAIASSRGKNIHDTASQLAVFTCTKMQSPIGFKHRDKTTKNPMTRCFSSKAVIWSTQFIGEKDSADAGQPTASAYDEMLKRQAECAHIDENGLLLWINMI